MISTVRYRVTRISWTPGTADRVYGSTGSGPERVLGAAGADLPECAVGDVLEIDYDDDIDERGEPVAARVVEASLSS